jgi:putative ABC transport system permease protein
MNRLVDDMRFGARLYGRSFISVSILLISLSLAIGGNAAMFSVVDTVLLKPFPYHDPDRLVLVWGGKREDVKRGLSGPDVADWQRQTHTFADLDVFIGNLRFALEGDPSEPLAGACIGARVLPLLGQVPLMGRHFVAADERPGAPSVVILSHSLWQSRFASDPTALGRTIRLNDQPYEIIGVTQKGFFFPDTDARLWVPAPCKLTGFNRRGQPLMHVVGRLKEGFTLADAQRDLDSVNRHLALTFPDTNRNTIAGVFPLKRIVIRDFRTALYLLLASMTLVLVIACANAAHIQLARCIEREPELAIRIACGASRQQLFAQLLTESSMLAVCAGALGLGVAWTALRAIKALALADIPRIEVASLDVRVIAFTATASLLSALVSGLWPALRGSRVCPDSTLKSLGSATTSSSGRLNQTVLAVSEVAAAVSLLVIAGLIVQSFVKRSRSDWGFSSDRLLLLSVVAPPEIKRNLSPVIEWSRAVVDRLKATEGVEQASVSDSVPIRWSTWKLTRLAVKGQLVTRGWAPVTWVVGPGFFRTIGTRILAGREFGDNDDRLAPPCVVVNRSLADKLWPSEPAVGKYLELLEVKTRDGQPPPEFVARVRRGDSTAAEDLRFLEPVEGKTWQVIGVVNDIRMFGLEHTPGPALYLDHRQNPRLRGWTPLKAAMEVNFLVRSGTSAEDSAARAKTAVLAVNPHATFAYVTSMSDLITQSIGGRGSNKLLLVVSISFSGLALMFAAIGIYGILMHGVQQRLREIGTRMALGGGTPAIVRLVLGYTVSLLAAGFAVGFPTAWMVARTVRSHLFGVSPTDTSTYLTAAAILTLSAVAASLIPLRRALHFDPAVLLRS